MEIMRMFLAVVFIIAYLCELILSQVECEDMVFMERGQRGMISCEYPLNFIAVFWYRGDSHNPFLRLEEGRPTKIDGFDITARGDMIIENVNIEDEGPYRISVLDADGVSQSGYTLINVTVPLSTNPHIYRCETSESEICHLVEDSMRPNVIVCHTTDTRPEVTFVWLTTSANEVENVNSKSVMNITTGLYTSYSVFQYDSRSFPLEYITCNAKGIAVNDIRNASIFVAGSKKDVPNNNHLTMKQGSILAMTCADEKFVLQKWSYTDLEGNIAELWSVYPGHESGPCLLNTRCKVNSKGLLEIIDFSFKDEGTYECIYGNDITSGRKITHIDVIITPKPAEILIEGCKSQEGCSKDVGFNGDLKVFLYGSRPRVEILCEVHEESKSHAYIFDHQNDFEEHPETGTFDTIYTVKYDIQKCSPSVHVACKTDETTLINVSQSHVHLATDQSSCNSQGKPGLIVFVVIFIIIIIVLGTLTFWKREDVRNFVRKRYSPKGDKSVTVIVEDTPGELTTFLPGGTEDVSATRTKKPVLCDQFCVLIHKSENVPGEDLIYHYTTTDKDAKPFDSVSNHLKSSPHDRETLHAVLEYLVSLTPNPCVPHVELCRLLEHLVEQNMMSGDKFLVVINKLRAKKLLLLEKYIEMTGPLLNSSAIERNTVITNLKHLLSKKLVTKEELIETLFHYFIFYKMETNAILGEVTELRTSSPGIPYPYFLQGIFKWQDKIGLTSDQTYAMLSLYNEIVKEHITNKEERLLIQIDKEKHQHQDISDSYVQALLCSTVEGAIDCEECWNMIVHGIETQKIRVNDFCDVYKKCIESNWMKEKELLYIWNLMLSKMEMNETQLVDISHLLLNKNQITHAQFNKTLYEARKNKQVSSELFKHEIASAILQKKMDQREWIQFTVEIFSEKLISKEEKAYFMVSIADTYMIPRETLKLELERLGMSVDERRAFLRPVPLKEDSESRKSFMQKHARNLKTSETGTT